MIAQAPLPDLLKRLWRHLGQRQRQFGLLALLMLISAFAEVVSLGLVLPFLGVLVAPDRALQHPLIAQIAHSFGINSSDDLVLPLTIIFAAAAIIAGAIRMLVLWANTRLAFASGADLSSEVYRRTLYQPYRVHVARNSSQVISGIEKVNAVVFGVLLPMLTLVSSTIVVLFITITLIAFDPVVASIAAVGFGGSYAVITWIFRRRLQRNSQRVAHEQTQVIKALQEGLGGIRDVLLDGTQPLYCEIYRQADQPLRRAQGNNAFIAASPRFAMEALGMVVIAGLAYGLSRQAGGLAIALPVLGTLALGAQRLLPALQLSFSAWASITATQASLADTLDLLEQPVVVDTVELARVPLAFEHTIRIKDVRFRYSSDGPWILDGLNLTIVKGARVGFVGSTGSGKSTALDVLMGLLEPTMGELLVDGQPISGQRIKAWQGTIAHVPQAIYLSDTTVAENIAFGVLRHAIDMDRVRRAARQAQIADFIEKQPGGYDAHVGERGIRLSGGQRQRIGIARALYKQATILVFDEATSALDNITERAVMDAIEGLDRNLTILLIAHRLSTVQRFNIIVELEHGRVIAQGTYEQLCEKSASFRSMARAVAGQRA